MAVRSLILATLVACSSAKAPSSDERAAIVSLSPALTDTIVALGAAEELVGISRYCSMPAGADLPRLGGVQDLPLESVYSLRPSLIVSSDSLRGPSQRLVRAGFKVERFSEGSLRDVLATFSRMGSAIGRAEQGRQLTARVEADLARLAQPIDARARRVLLVFSSQGEPVTQVWAAGPGGWLGELLERIGLRNALSQGPSYAQLSTEGVIAVAPEIIVELNGQALDESAPIAKRWSALNQVPAVKNRRLHRLSGEALLRPGPRLVELARALAALR
jgi:iron complex transport system substrate-binding protein